MFHCYIHGWTDRYECCPKCHTTVFFTSSSTGELADKRLKTMTWPEIVDQDLVVDQLNYRITQLEKALELIVSQCGLPDSGDACRAIIKTAKKVLENND